MSEIINLPIIQIPGTAFFPHTVLPIYITHPSLVSMVKDIVASGNGEMLAIRMEESLSFPLHHDICGAGVPIIIEELENGHIKVAIHGIMRVKIINNLQDLPYQVVEAMEVPDTNDVSYFKDSEISDLRELLLRWLVHFVRNSQERDIFIKTLSTVRHYTDYLAMFLIKDLEIKQSLLATLSLRERINLLSLILRDNLGNHLEHDSPLEFKENFCTIDILKDYAQIEHNSKFGQ